MQRLFTLIVALAFAGPRWSESANAGVRGQALAQGAPVPPANAPTRPSAPPPPASTSSAAPVAAEQLPPLPREPEALIHHRDRAKLYAAGGLVLTYAAFSTYAYFAWFRGKENHGVGVTFEGFGVDTYAGGVDKLGHAWSGYWLTRATTKFLTNAGWPRLGSSIAAASISQVFFTLSEYEDSLVYQFEISDVIANVVGAAFGVLMTNAPALDRLIDFRIEYFPSLDYRRLIRSENNIDFFQDYSGQSYMLALHLDAIPRMPRVLGYLDLVTGFETRNYAPTPVPRLEPATQRLYLGVALNLQHVLDAMFCDCLGRRIGHTLAEYVAVPYTTLKAVDFERSR